MSDTAAPFPDRSTGLRFRALVPSDIDAWLDLILRMAEADQPIWFERREDLAEVFASMKNDPVHNSVAGFDDSGAPRAFGRVTMNEGSRKAHSWGGVDPAWRRRGTGTAVYRWQQARAGQRGAAILRTYAEEGNAGHNALLRMMGNEIVRYWTEMTRPLHDPLPDAVLDDGLVFADFDAGISEQIRQAHNEAFKDHWGSEPRDAESWKFTVAHPDFRPEWSLAVLDAGSGNVAGYHMASLDPHFSAIHGYTEGYTELVGVRHQYRGRGIAPAMLAEAMRRYKADGIDHAGLQVDTENPSGAHGLYEAMGYRPTHRTFTYDKVLGH
ncbi:GNAT family N-acetyltransferase [Arthrobacter castelli]|uniref:GNAT family N-acetyltransferase n=1 Tax=Arthrobacter castelli TaxID=271431 RepID=UPI00047DE00E|nr:GNAT family N-acetyltransferase [Arthrobacter castelli]